MKKIFIVLCVGITMLFSSLVYANVQKELENHWAKDIILDLSSKKIVTGYEDGTFQPDHSVTRAEFVAILNRAMNFEEASDLSFKDVKASDWFYNDLKAAVSQKVISGYEDGSFLPNGNLTRGEAGLMISRLMENQDENLSQDLFTDDKEIPSWAKNGIYAAVKMNLIQGYPDNSFKANKTITRAEAAVIVDRLLKYKESSKAEKENLYVSEDNSLVSDKKVKGDLVVTAELGDGTITLKDSTVEGDLVVLGGGSHSVNLENVTIKGKIILRKENVRVNFVKNNTVHTLVVEKPAFVDSENPNEKIAKIVVEGEENEGKTTISVKTKELIIKEKANVKVNENVDTLTVEKAAKGSIVEIKKNKTISTLETKADIEVKGHGKINKIEKGKNTVKLEKTVQVATEKQEGAVASQSSGSHAKATEKVKSIRLNPVSADINEDDGQIDLKIEYTPENAENKDIEYNIKEGKTVVKVEKSAYDRLRITGINNGKFEIEVLVKENPTIKQGFSGKVSGQVVRINGDTEGLTAKDQKISGIQAGKVYVLGVDGFFLSVDSNGKVSQEHDAEETAKLYSIPIPNQPNILEITGLDNSKTYRVFKYGEEDLLNEKLNYYLTLSPDSVTVENVYDIFELGDYLGHKIDDKIDEFVNEPVKKHEWEGKKVEFEKNQKKLVNAINKIEAEINKNIKSAKEKIVGIDNSKTIETIKSTVKELDDLLIKIPAKKHEDVGTSNLEKLEEVKAELENYEKWTDIIEKAKSTQNFSFDDKGLVKIPEGLDPEFTVYVKWKNSNNHVEETKQKIASKTEFLFADEIRKYAMGKSQGQPKKRAGIYVADLKFDNFKHLPELLESTNDQPVTYLELFEPVDIDNNWQVKKPNEKIEIDWDNAVIRWDSIPHAEYYEVIARITFASHEMYMGKYYVEGQNLSSNSYETINEISNVSVLPTQKGNRGYSWPIAGNGQFNDESRVRVKYKIENKEGKKTNEIKLSEFVPMSKGNPDTIDQYLGGQNDLVDLDIYIVPVNYTELYLTKNEKATDIDHHKSIYIKNVYFKDFLEKFRIPKDE